MVQVIMKITRTVGVKGTIYKTIEVEDLGSDELNIEAAELKFLNEYINRDTKIMTFDSVSKAKKFAKLEIESDIVLYG